MLYYASQPGQAIAIPMPYDVPMPLAIGGWPGSLAFKSIVTEVGIRRSVGFQSQSTLDSRTFITVFGERPGKLRVAGLSFSGGCSGDATTGIEYVNGFFSASNAAATGRPLTVAIGTGSSGVFTAFLVDLAIELNRPELRMAQFGLEFLVMPQKAGG